MKKTISGLTYKAIAEALAELAEVPGAGGNWDSAYQTAREDLAINLPAEFIAAYEEGF